MGSIKPEPATCSELHCAHSSGRTEASWVTKQVCGGCECCDYNATLLCDGHNITTPEGNIFQCCQGKIIQLETPPVHIEECSQNAKMLSQAPAVKGYESYKMVLCDDLEDKTCERDMQMLCPSGFHLCTHLEFWALNDNWEGNFNASERPIGEIYCGQDSWSAGHFTLMYQDESELSFDYPRNSSYSSSRPSCSKFLNNIDCNHKEAIALCCSRNPGCGDGVVEAPLEECDDGNTNNEDQCLNSCVFRIQSIYILYH